MITLFHKIIVIGGGASGMMAAITSKDMGCEVAILEGNDRIGKKILSTGNGRCNITNENCAKNRYHSENPNFFDTVLNSFTPSDTVDFFSSLGLPIVTLEEGKMYPMSLQSSSVLDILRYALEDRGIPVYTNEKVKKIISKGNSFEIITNSDTKYSCEKIILASGGKSLPSTGSDGSGYELSKMLGHSIVAPLPAIVQLKLDYRYLKALSGIKFDGNSEIYVDNELIRKEFGETLFTDYGISGPPILQLSRMASYYLHQHKDVSLKIDMMPTFSENDLKNFFLDHWELLSYRSVADSFIGIINKKIIPVLLKECGINDIQKPCSVLSFSEKLSILKILKCWQFKVCDTNSFKDSQVTAGGLNTKEVIPPTLQSKIVNGLYFCGEILDVDGDCGGFNLQWAWSSGFVAGKNAALTK